MSLNSNEEIKNFCLKIIKTENAEGVIELLKKHNLWNDMSSWRFYGDKSNNISVINNQAPDATKALVEKIANSFDARLMLESRKRGIDPKGKNTPKNIKEAMQKFFYDDKKFSNFMSLENETAIFATNTREKPCISIIDKGEGQTPEMVPDTFLSLNKENKEGILFTQGRYNQGGAGGLNYCQNGISVILTRRCPEINTDKTDNNDNWSLTITRQVSAKERKLPEPCYMYLAPIKHKPYNKILSFKADSLKLFPKNMDPYKKEIEYGTLIKFYGYKMKGAQTNIVLDFMYHTEIMMPDAVMPLRLHECRENYKGTGKNFREQVTSLQGFMYRNSSGKSIEEGFPLKEVIEFKGYRLEVNIYAFKYDPKQNFAKRRKRKNEGIVFCLGGQHYGEYSSDFFRRKNVGLDYLKDDLIVIINCTGIDGDLKNKLFKTDKATIIDSPESKDLEEQIEDLLENNEQLLELKNIRRKQKVDEQLKDEKPFEDLLDKVIKKNPALAALFDVGPRLSNPWAKQKSGSNKDKEKTKLQFYPSFFRFQKKLEENEIYNRDGNINKRLRFDFETDAENDYFLREQNHGEYSIDMNLVKKSNEHIAIKKEDQVFTQYLKDGKWLVSVKIPEQTEVGDKLELIYNINDDQNDGWSLKSIVTIISPNEKKRRKQKKRKKENQNKGDLDQPTGFSLPVVTWVKRDKWTDHDFNETSALKIIKADSKEINGKVVENWDFYLNRDNKYLENELKTNKKDLHEEIILNRYKLAIVFFSLSLIDYLKKYDDSKVEEDISRLTAGISPVILDVIDSVGDLSEVSV